MDKVTFGPFRLFPAERRLLRSGSPVRIGDRALDLLIAMVASAGSVVSKKDLIAIAWPSLHVDESNLRVNIAGLRKALGDTHANPRYIASVAGRGYCFIGQTTFEPGSQPATCGLYNNPEFDGNTAQLVEALLSSREFALLLKSALKDTLRQENASPAARTNTHSSTFLA